MLPAMYTSEPVGKKAGSPSRAMVTTVSLPVRATVPDARSSVPTPLKDGSASLWRMSRVGLISP